VKWEINYGHQYTRPIAFELIGISCIQAHDHYALIFSLMGFYFEIWRYK